MYIVPMAWLYVALMMAVAEAMSPMGTVLGAFFTLLLYGALPLTIVLYILGTPARRRARRALEASSGQPPDGSSQPPGDAVATVRKEP